MIAQGIDSPTGARRDSGSIAQRQEPGREAMRPESTSRMSSEKRILTDFKMLSAAEIADMEARETELRAQRAVDRHRAGWTEQELVRLRAEPKA